MQKEIVLPESVRPIRTLLYRLHGRAKGRVMEAVSLYERNLPDDRLRYSAAAAKKSPITWGPKDWPKLFGRKCGPDEAIIIHWQAGVAWLYRGPILLYSDMFGPATLVCDDRLHFQYPVFSKFSIDTREKLEEN